MTSNTSAHPPWTQYPGQPPHWAGWKQGSGHVWMISVFLPFWSAASPAEREAYLLQWPPPDEDWRAWIARQY